LKKYILLRACAAKHSVGKGVAKRWSECSGNQQPRFKENLEQKIKQLKKGAADYYPG